MLYFIVNETSRTGKGRNVWKEIRQILKEEQMEYHAYRTEYAGHASLLAKQVCKAAKRENDCLVIVGGDGTINEVLNGVSMADFEHICFGVIPTGSGNDFARGLKLSKDPKENLKRIILGMQSGLDNCRRIDLGRVSWEDSGNSRIFAISAGFGLDAIVCKKALHSKLKTFLNKLHLGKLTYLFLTVQTLFSMQTAELQGVFYFIEKCSALSMKQKPSGRDAHLAEKKIIASQYRSGAENPASRIPFYNHATEPAVVQKKNMHKVIFAAAMNLRAEGGGVPMAPHASAEDGLLSVCSASGIPKWRTFFCLPLLVAAHHENIHGFEITNCREAHFHLSCPMVLHADGEYCGEVKEVTFTCLPEMLRLIN